MRGIGTFLLTAWLAVPVQAATLPVTAQAWLERLQAAEQQHSYQGTFVYERNGSFSTHAIWHRVEANGQVRERLLQLDGPLQEMLRLDAQLQCISTQQVEQRASVSGLVVQQLQPAQLAAHYDLRILGQSRVAGHAAVVLALLPRDQYRYGLELHLDQQTGLALKSLLLNEQGQLLERFQFTQLDSRSELTDAALQPGPDCLAVAVAPVAPALVSPWRAAWLPPGFSLIGTEQRDGQSANESLTWLIFSDGLARFSVFIEALPSTAVEDLHRQLGPTVVVSQQMQGVSGPVMVTVVGEVPLVAAERVVLSMGLAAEQATP
ncbi:MAG: MucB/RseB C-terminal domain-containing protein [Pseudomonas sp.]|uniref:MucB/RseB C-terminal domain-containing protein n=1 Tax=Pseudomonas sp. TaxID=306 RepID=UPI002733A745|nr:MucB/RseB C-terminal domain-containing protein [Pseudomonas sp.]MDP3847371.1 MucB/RseB C-terminal domain-containing protein [Pseudomonas sp.]